MMSLKPLPPEPIAATLTFSFGETLPGTTLAVFGLSAELRASLVRHADSRPIRDFLPSTGRAAFAVDLFEVS